METDISNPGQTQPEVPYLHDTTRGKRGNVFLFYFGEMVLKVNRLLAAILNNPLQAMMYQSNLKPGIAVAQKCEHHCDCMDDGENTEFYNDLDKESAPIPVWCISNCK